MLQDLLVNKEQTFKLFNTFFFFVKLAVVARRIALNTATWSGRMNIDLEDLLREEFLEDVIVDDPESEEKPPL